MGECHSNFEASPAKIELFCSRFIVRWSLLKGVTFANEKSDEVCTCKNGGSVASVNNVQPYGDRSFVLEAPQELLAIGSCDPNMFETQLWPVSRREFHIGEMERSLCGFELPVGDFLGVGALLFSSINRLFEPKGLENANQDEAIGEKGDRYVAKLGFAKKGFSPSAVFVLIVVGFCCAFGVFVQAIDKLWAGKHVASFIYTTIGVAIMCFCGIFLLWVA